MSNLHKATGTHSTNRAPVRKNIKSYLVLCALGLAVAAMIPSLTNRVSEADASACSAPSAPNVCAAGLCTPWVGTAPAYDNNVCCDASGTCYPVGRGCIRGQIEYSCPYGQRDTASGAVHCYMELSLTPPPYEDGDFCCDGETDVCTAYTGSGCDGPTQYVATCNGDSLIMDDGTAHCFPAGEC